MNVEPDIHVAGLSVAYERSDGSFAPAVHSVNLSVFPREIVSIVGPSGCGKTSILRAILNEIPHSGTCRLNTTRSSDLSYLQQSPALLPWRTALENVTLGQEIRGRMNRDSIDRAANTLEDFGLGGQTMLAYPSELSSGMQQRVAIARALESSAKVLLCDEPFSAIDFINRLRLNRIFKRRCSSAVSVLMVTHNIDEAIFLSSRIYVMSGSPGRVVKEISPVFHGAVDDAVAVRDHPAFEQYFNDIWQSMEMHERS